MAIVITLGGVNLSKHMIWENQYKTTQVRQDYKETLGGGVSIHAQTVEKGRVIKLTSYDSGWLTRNMVEQLEQLVNEAGVVMTLVLGNNVFDVMFAHHLGNAFVYDPISFRLQGDQADYFKGELLLITV